MADAGVVRRRVGAAELEEIARRTTTGKVRRTREGWMVQCPVPRHPDRDPSLSIWTDPGGRLHVHCWGGCSYGEIVEQMRARGVRGPLVRPWNVDESGHATGPAGGAEGEALEREAPVVAGDARWAGKVRRRRPVAMRRLRHPTLGTPVERWTYRAAGGGEEYGYECRYEDADGERAYRTWTWWHAEEWGERGVRIRCRMPPRGVLRPLWGLDRLSGRARDTVLVAEGARTAARIQSLVEDEPITVVSWMGGAEAVGHTDWTPLAGRAVLIVPDDDFAGWKAARWLKGHLREGPGAAAVRVLDLAGELPRMPGEPWPRDRGTGWDAGELPRTAELREAWRHWRAGRRGAQAVGEEAT